MNARILVTGGSGLLGHSLRAVLPDALYLSSKDCDLRNLPDVIRLFEKQKPTHVIHLAGRVGGVRENDAKNADFLTDNLLLNTNVLHAAQRHGVRRLLSLLSSCCYPFFEDRPTTEKNLHAGLPYEGNLGYGYAKRALEIQTRLFVNQYGVHYATLTPVTMFGPHDHFSVDGHVIGALIQKCAAAKKTGGTLEVWGDGSAVRQFVYAPDVARILSDLIFRENTGNCIITPDNGISIKNLADLIIRTAGFTGPVRFDPSKLQGLRKKVLQSENFCRLFPNFTFTPMPEAVAQTVAWYRKSSRSSRKPSSKSINSKPKRTTPPNG